ncbi:shikimate kinase [Candidatus Vidania fulgoroideorum]
MGVGKTYLTEKLSKYLKKKNFDIDRLFFKIYNFIIYKQLNFNNENFFRKIEKNLLKLLSIKNGIFSTGGGIVERSINIYRLRMKYVILIKRKTLSLFKRPIFRENLYKTRKFFYINNKLFSISDLSLLNNLNYIIKKIIYNEM